MTDEPTTQKGMEAQCNVRRENKRARQEHCRRLAWNIVAGVRRHQHMDDLASTDNICKTLATNILTIARALNQLLTTPEVMQIQNFLKTTTI